jgi:hypothetical protein
MYIVRGFSKDVLLYSCVEDDKCEAIDAGVLLLESRNFDKILIREAVIDADKIIETKFLTMLREE